MQQHPWVEDYANYEAVLVCTNELPTWDAAAVMRGFQTYLFDDGTTKGNESFYTHANTGGIVRYEGGVLAIDYGQGDLSVMLPDLMSALYALGWRRAEVYHPAESIDALLDDIGRSIPAHQDFDVAAAKEKPLSAQPEALSLLSRAISGSRDREIISAEFKALGDTATNNAFSGLASAGPILLMDDEQGDDDESGEIMVSLGVDMGDEPLVPDLSGGDGLQFTPPPPRSQATSGDFGAVERGRLEATIREQERQENEREAARLLLEQETAKRLADERVAQSRGAQLVQIEAEAPLSRTPSTSSSGQKPIQPQQQKQQQPAAVAADGLVVGGAGGFGGVATLHVGRCAFHFPPAGEAFDCDTLDTLTSNLGDGDATFLYPGATKGDVRWDVLDEIQESFPWTAEKLSDLAGFTGLSRQLVASAMLSLKKEKAYAGLRDLLIFAGKDVDTISGDMLKVSPDAEMLLAHIEAFGGLVMVMDTIIQKLGALALCSHGSSFVDILIGPDDLAPEVKESFSVRSLVESGVSRTFVVVVDAADGPFVFWLAELLRAVVSMHGNSIRSRITIQPPAKPVVAEDPVVALDEISQMKESMNLLLAQMAKLSGGIPVAAS